MLIRGSLFNKGHWTRQAGLSDVLDAHKRRILNRIRGITDLEQMNDPFIHELVAESLVTPVSLHFDQMTRKMRTEDFDARDFPDRFTFNVEAGRRYPKTVARISVPFSGDRSLLEYTPNECVLNFPRGEVSGNLVQFDVVFWGHHDDDQRVVNNITENRRLLELFTGNVNKQVKAFNETLLGEVKPVFEAKLADLTKQHSVLDALGIKEEPEPVYSVGEPVVRKPKRSGATRAVQIIQYVETQYVQQLNQVNNNSGDVNNAIQSGE